LSRNARRGGWVRSKGGGPGVI